ncbi:hypothetical protein Tco_1244371 [Tanacetum coccineum]
MLVDEAMNKLNDASSVDMLDSLVYSMLVGCMDHLDDIFGASVNLEDTHLKDGFQEGYEAGFASGKDDGHEVGLKTGVQKKIKEMDELVSKYPIMEPENETVTDIMGSLRLKFRAICATLNLKLEYNGYPNAADPNGDQF